MKYLLPTRFIPVITGPVVKIPYLLEVVCQGNNGWNHLTIPTDHKLPPTLGSVVHYPGTSVRITVEFPVQRVLEELRIHQDPVITHHSLVSIKAGNGVDIIGLGFQVRQVINTIVDIYQVKVLQRELELQQLVNGR